MRPTAPAIRVHSTMDGAKQEMSIDTHALQHIMSVLTDLYADPVTAVVREYSTNGYDAIIEAGVNEPLRVMTPTTLAPSLVIQDFGVGMSTDTILNRYSMYGHSTKRDTDAQVGMLGVGCKSGLTYASSFTVKSIHNGVETVAMVSRNARGIGEIQIIDTKASNARTGTTITIPVHNIPEMNEKIKTFFSFWKPGTVLVDGKVPVAFDQSDDNRKWFSDRDQTIFYSDAGYENEATVVMGNVPYRLRSPKILGDYDSAFSRYGRLVVFAPIGSVAFAPSREELSYSGATLRFIDDLVSRIEKMKATIVDDAMAAATTKDEALRAATSISNLSFIDLANTPAKWNGKDVPLTHNAFHKSSVMLWSSEKPGWGSSPWSRAQRQPWGQMNAGALVIVNAPKNVSAAVKHRIIEKYGRHQSFYFVENDGTDLPLYGWVDMEEWTDFLANLPKATATPRASGGGGWKSTAVNDGREWLGEKSYGNVVDGKGKYVLIDSDTLNDLQDTYSARTFRAKASALGYTPVRVYARSQAAFVEMANEVITRQELNGLFDKAAGKITEAQRLSMTILVNLDAYIPRDKIGQALDPRFAEMVESVKDVDETVWEAAGRPTMRATPRRTHWLYKDYPMIETWGQTPAAMIEYVNALYTYRTGKDAQ